MGVKMNKHIISVEVDDETLIKIVKGKINLSDLVKQAVDNKIKENQEKWKEENKDALEEINKFHEKNGHFNIND